MENIDIMTPGFTFPLLTSVITQNLSSENSKKYPLMCVMESKPCPHTGCTGQLSNMTLQENIYSWCRDLENYPENNKPLNLDAISHYPESVLHVIREKVNEANENNGMVIHNGQEIKFHNYICYMDEQGPAEIVWDEAKKNVNEPTSLRSDGDNGADVIECNVCNNWYVVCLSCKKPCFIKSFDGTFSQEIYNQETNEFKKGESITLCRKTINLTDGVQTECIGVREGSEHVEFKSNLPWSIVKPVREWIDSNDSESENESEDYCGSYDDWWGWYQLEDKHVIWARDPRLNLYIENCKFTPILTGACGGCPVFYQCYQCNKTYDFTDK